MPKELLNETNNPGGARWCTNHHMPRLECTKNRSVRQGGGPCHAAAVRGTDACKTHGGHRLEVLKAKGKAVITAWSAIGEAAQGKGISSSAAVLGMLQQSWLRAALYGQLLHNQVSSDQESGIVETDEGSIDVTGLIGNRFGSAGQEGRIYAVSEEARALVALEAAERDRVVKYAKTAHDMGISDKLIGLAERWGDLVVSRIMVVIAGLQLSPQQEALVPELIQAHLGSIDLSGPQ